MRFFKHKFWKGFKHALKLVGNNMALPLLCKNLSAQKSTKSTSTAEGGPEVPGKDNIYSILTFIQLFSLLCFCKEIKIPSWLKQ